MPAGSPNPELSPKKSTELAVIKTKQKYVYKHALAFCI